MTGLWTLQDSGRLQRITEFKTHRRAETADPQFHLNIKTLQARLEPISDESTPRRDDGTVGLDHEYWAENLPAGNDDVRIYLAHEKIKKVLSTYLSVYSQTTEVFPKWIVVGPRSGRMAASKPNVINIPKRKNGIRALFVPHEGYLLTKADYCAQELFTLCEIMLGMGIIGPLYKALTSGVDVHRYSAALVLGKPVEEITAAERQAQKAMNFGVPGGLGPKKLAAYAYSNYGVEWTIDEARDRRHRFLMTFTDIQDYLCKLKMSQDDALQRATGMDRAGWAKTLGAKGWNVIKEMTLHPDCNIQEAGLNAERQCCVVLPSGRQRGHCRFTEAANSYFQGLASDVTKTAVWLAYRAGLRIILVVHDEIVIESVPDAIEQDAAMLEKSMLDAFKICCPRMGAYAKVEIERGLKCWGPATNLSGAPLTFSV